MTESPSNRGVALVMGASGYIGSHLVARLRARGYKVRAVARNRAVLEDRDWAGVDCVGADALDPASLDRVLAGVDVAWYLVHSMAAGPDFGNLDRRAATNFREAAGRAGIKRIIYLGGLAPDNPDSLHLRSRCETGEILRQGPVPVTEIRAGMIIGPGSAAFEVMRDLVNYLPVMITPRWVASRSPPIALEDLLAYLTEVAEIPAAAGEVYDAAGPEFLSYAEIMQRLGRILGRNPVIIPVPVLTPRLSSYWLRLVTTVPTNIARALIDGLVHDVHASDRRLLELIPRPLKDVDASIRAALEAERDHDLPAHWVEGSIRCRNFEPRYAFYAKRATDAVFTPASSEALWKVICRFGTDDDFFSCRILWWLRRAVDGLFGGPSFRRRRRNSERLRIGDVVDAWRVIALQPERKLTLLLEMKLPGAGVLEFDIIPRGAHREVRAAAYFHPAGIWGLFYWYPLIPFHHLIFRTMTREIARRALQTEGT